MIVQHYEWSGDDEMDAVCTVNLIKVLHNLKAIRLETLNFHQSWNDVILMSMAWPTNRTDPMLGLERHQGLSRRRLESK